MDTLIMPNSNGDVFRNLTFIENRTPVETKQLQFLSIYDGKQRARCSVSSFIAIRDHG